VFKSDAALDVFLQNQVVGIVTGSASNSSSLQADDAASEGGAAEELAVESADVWAVGSIWISPEEVLATMRPNSATSRLR
jgi:hypothetical protein